MSWAQSASTEQEPQPKPGEHTVPRPAWTHWALVEQATQAPVEVSQMGVDPCGQAPASEVHGGTQIPLKEKPLVLQV